ncbi:hypothetical protein CC85DRAFT_118052 [Cutaneotrichosporon oleaginosum]|uniref:Uncharacterized protein n=1 Tax=Cutaneotrichosporon oleaginosum TaxID=879819 RepID=A0A0J0XKC5_9TREE|nr:uncharacterized protein CC85DRAFT_118052 [Cutaneotrichosporon oleaginosum]KLT41546.1 hypothetical protein CC85DRAFT_118052 [Cutaneotrichosporon oleaginosum]TXT09314.1 hypothetical protein COLE_03248 [Cutaneotrichosporon oleaginosum]
MSSTIRSPTVPHSYATPPPRRTASSPIHLAPCRHPPTSPIRHTAHATRHSPSARTHARHHLIIRSSFHDPFHPFGHVIVLLTKDTRRVASTVKSVALLVRFHKAQT